MMRIIVVPFFVLIAIIVLFFSLLNFQIVEINLYITTIKIPLVFALTIELVVGVFIGFLAAFIHIVKLKSQYKSLSRQVSKANHSD